MIPKADLYIVDGAEQEKERYFFTRFCDDLQAEGILVPSQFAHEQGRNSYKGLCSLAAAGLAPDEQDKLDYQQGVARLISDKASEYLENIGSAIGEDAVLQHHRDALANQLRSTKKMLQFYFGEENVYFLPVSAQGEEIANLQPENGTNGDTDENGNGDTEADEEEAEAPLLRLSSQTEAPRLEGANGSTNELGYPPNQKLAEYVFILPVVLLTDQHVQEEVVEEELPF